MLLQTYVDVCKYGTFNEIMYVQGQENQRPSNIGRLIYFVKRIQSTTPCFTFLSFHFLTEYTPIQAKSILTNQPHP